MQVLGINAAYHECAAALLRQGEVLLAVEEERLTRVKHGKRALASNPDKLPWAAIEHCLAAGQTRLSEIDCVAYSLLPGLRSETLGMDPAPLDTESGFGTPEGEREFDSRVRSVPLLLARAAGESGLERRVKFVSHHLAHAASAFYSSRFEEAAVLVVDGIAEKSTCWLGQAGPTGLQCLEEISYPHSLGLLWERIAVYLGFGAQEAAKVMGLAAYGERCGKSSTPASSTGSAFVPSPPRCWPRKLPSGSSCPLVGPARDQRRWACPSGGKVHGQMAPRILVVDDNQELLSLLRQLLEEAGYEVLAASKGRPALELAKENKPNLALLDVLLPDMMGFQLAESLRKEQPDLPVIFTSGVFKGGRHSQEAKLKHGSAGYFEKPFEGKKMVEALSRIVPPEKPTAPPIESAFEVELDLDVEEDQPQDQMELTGRIRVSGANITAELKGDNLTATAPVKGQSPVREYPPGKPAPAPPTRAVDPKSRHGEIKDNLPSLITAFYLAKETGELGLQRGKVKKVVYFERGIPVFALSNLASDRFGQFLVRVGKVKPEALTDAAAVAAQGKRRTGDVLIERGLLKDTERMYFVAQQVKAIIYSLFGWEEGAYTLSFRDRVSAEPIKLDIHPANLIARGVKKLYKPERLRGLISPEDRFLPSLQPDYQLSDVELEKWEAELLPKIDGTRTVAELAALAKRPEPVVHAFLGAMLALSLIERRR